VFAAVDDIMRPINEDIGLEKVSQNWTHEMKEQHKTVVSDFKSGNIKWKDVSLVFV
jgi:hypothetical protein